MSSQDANLDAVSKIVRQHGTVELFVWWRDALAKFNISGGRKSLCECLGVEPYTQQFHSFRAAKAARDEHLRAAYTLMSNRSVRALQSRIRWFLTNTFPEVQVYLGPPKALSLVARELFLAVRTGIRIPDSVSQLSEILSGKVDEQVENRTVSAEPVSEGSADCDLL